MIVLIGIIVIHLQNNPVQSFEKPTFFSIGWHNLSDWWVRVRLQEMSSCAEGLQATRASQFLQYNDFREDLKKENNEIKWIFHEQGWVRKLKSSIFYDWKELKLPKNAECLNLHYSIIIFFILKPSLVYTTPTQTNLSSPLNSRECVLYYLFKTV